ncbi:hypothetical protein DB390_19490 [Pseudomonas aeruginosa]|nr:hypothetical protein DB390_19490 [Pseudomonas aeruginosa]
MDVFVGDLFIITEINLVMNPLNDHKGFAIELVLDVHQSAIRQRQCIVATCIQYLAFGRYVHQGSDEADGQAAWPFGRIDKGLSRNHFTEWKITCRAGDPGSSFVQVVL